MLCTISMRPMHTRSIGFGRSPSWGDACAENRPSTPHIAAMTGSNFILHSGPIVSLGVLATGQSGAYLVPAASSPCRDDVKRRPGLAAARKGARGSRANRDLDQVDRCH